MKIYMTIIIQYNRMCPNTYKREKLLIVWAYHVVQTTINNFLRHNILLNDIITYHINRKIEQLTLHTDKSPELNDKSLKAITVSAPYYSPLSKVTPSSVANKILPVLHGCVSAANQFSKGYHGLRMMLER